MLQIAWKTFFDRWHVFAGAIVTVSLGIALVQSSLLALVSAAVPPVPPGFSEAEALTFREAHYGALIVLSMQLALITFVTVFIVSSTFSFTVSQRRRELSLLRLSGADRRQIRNLLVGEALLLGVVGSVIGIALGFPALNLQDWMLERFAFVPPGFVIQWRWWIVLVSLGTGTLLAVLGVLAASRQAAAVRPLEALRDSGQATRVMTVSRWSVGLVFTVAGVFLLLFFPAGDAALPPYFVQITPFLVTVPLVIGFTALAPIIVPLTARLFSRVFRGPLGHLAVAGLRSDSRRSASTAAPIMLLIAFVASIAGTLSSITEAGRQEALDTVRGDLLVTSAEPAATRLTEVDGVAVASQESTVLVEIEYGSGDDGTWYEAHDGLAVDPAAFVDTRDVEPVDGDLHDLHDSAIAVSPNAWERKWQVGDELRIRVDETEHVAEVVALLPPTVSGPELLLSPELASSTEGPWQHIVQLTDDADEAKTAAALAAVDSILSVQSVDTWISSSTAADEELTLNIMIVLLGTTMLYTVVAIINAVVISASERGREFATSRVTGFTRTQVVGTALLESQAVVAIGLILGGVAASASILGVALAIRTLLGFAVLSIPWPLLLGLALGTAGIVGLTSVIATLAALRTPPIRLVAARE